MAGHVQEEIPQQPAVKRGAETELEPAPLAKRPAEDTANQVEVENTVETRSSSLPENGKPLAELQPSHGGLRNGMSLGDSIPGDLVEAQNGEGHEASIGQSPATLTSPSATEAAKSENKQLKGEDALSATAEGSSAQKIIIEPVFVEASETASEAKLVGGNISSEPHAPQAPAPAAEEIPEAPPLAEADTPVPSATPSLAPVAALASRDEGLIPLAHPATAESMGCTFSQVLECSKAACVLPLQPTPEPSELEDPDKTTPVVVSVDPMTAPVE